MVAAKRTCDAIGIGSRFRWTIFVLIIENKTNKTLNTMLEKRDHTVKHELVDMIAGCMDSDVLPYFPSFAYLQVVLNHIKNTKLLSHTRPKPKDLV